MELILIAITLLLFLIWPVICLFILNVAIKVQILSLKVRLKLIGLGYLIFLLFNVSLFVFEKYMQAENIQCIDELGRYVCSEMKSLILNFIEMYGFLTFNFTALLSVSLLDYFKLKNIRSSKVK